MEKNVTGMDMAPALRGPMEETEKMAIPPEGTLDDLKLARTRWLHDEGESIVGSVPIPGTLRGLGQSVVAMAKGERLTTLVDKLGERMAFERTGTRLYDLMIEKCEMRYEDAPIELLRRLHLIREDELNHFRMLAGTARALGADPTAITPSADVAGVMSMGLVQVLSDPRTTVTQGLNAILVAELADNDGWELLVRLAEHFSLPQRDDFRRALAEEEQHLADIRAWLSSQVLTDAEMLKKTG